MYFPTFSLGSYACGRIRVAGPLFPRANGPKCAEKLRGPSRDFGWGEADHLRAHSIRRGAAQALMSSGRSSAQLLKAYQWPLSAYKLFLDFEAVESAEPARVSMEISDGKDLGARDHRTYLSYGPKLSGPTLFRNLWGIVRTPLLVRLWRITRPCSCPQELRFVKGARQI